MFNSAVYKQHDSRWGSLPYPTKAYSFAGNGCGCCAVTHCVIEIEKFKKLTPADTRKYMVKHATRGHGTTWAGITDGLEHWGYKVDRPNISASMASAWKILDKYGTGNVTGVLLFRKGTKGGVTWTGSGHYVAFVDYKIKDGEHWFRTKDSSRRNTGWYCYERHMKGLLPQIWICKRLAEALKKGSKGKAVETLQKNLNKLMGLSLVVDGIFGAKTDRAVRSFQAQNGLAVDGIVGNITQKKIDEQLENPKQSTQPAAVTSGKGVDVSYWQGKNIDWKKVKKAGYDYAILRASYTGQKSFALAEDSTFATNVKNAFAAGLKVGAYHYSQAISVAEAKKEAEYVVRRLQPYRSKISLPVVFDWEFGGRLNASKAKSLGRGKCTDICEAFCEVIKAAGFEPMVYANLSTFNGYLYADNIRKFAKVWLAQYSSSKGMSNVDWWQYSSSAKVSGIPGNVDVNKVYKV